jgi:hypothetical protein
MIGVACLVGCSSVGPTDAPKVDAERIEFAAGKRDTARGAFATLIVPKPFVRKANHAWWIEQDGVAAALLTVEAAPAPDIGMDAWVAMRIRKVESGGQAGVTRNERIEIQDLDARLIEASDLRGDARSAVMMVVVEDEKNLIVATIYATADVMDAGHSHFEAALRSLELRNTP